MLENLVDALLTEKKMLVWIPPGMGKTSLVIEALSNLLPQSVLILAPLSLHTWWHRNLEFCPHTATVESYDSSYTEVHAKVLVCDESILIKNRKTQRYQRLFRWVEQNKPEYIWLLSGNPISKYADDLWAQLHLLYPRKYRSYWRFVAEHCLMYQDQWGVHIYDNKSSLEELKSLPHVLYSDTIYPDSKVPDLQFYEHKVEIDAGTWEVCRQAYKQLVLASQRLPNAMAATIRINQLLSDPQILGQNLPRCKVEYLSRWLQTAEKPVVVFTSYKIDLEKRMEAVPGKKLFLHGDVPPESRQFIVDRINRGEVDVAFFTPGVGRFGFSLPDVPNLVFLDLPLIYDHFFQAVYRVRRLGSSRDLNRIHILLSNFPVEIRLWTLLQRKSKFSLWDLIREMLSVDVRTSVEERY
jgi:SNF2 family DNA or RNA helicase